MAYPGFVIFVVSRVLRSEASRSSKLFTLTRVALSALVPLLVLHLPLIATHSLPDYRARLFPSRHILDQFSPSLWYFIQVFYNLRAISSTSFSMDLIKIFSVGVTMLLIGSSLIPFARD